MVHCLEAKSSADIRNLAGTTERRDEIHHPRTGGMHSHICLELPAKSNF
jgi:hypothetical protein